MYVYKICCANQHLKSTTKTVQTLNGVLHIKYKFN